MSNSNVVYKQTEVSLVGSNETNLQVLGWCHSRPGLVLEDVNKMDVMKLDVPVNELPSVTMSIYAPIIIRELITCLRDHSLWSRTSRVENLSEQIFVSEFYTGNDEYYEEILAKIKSDKSKGVTQDEFRLQLPITTMCGFTTTLSFRTWIKVIKFANTLETEALIDSTEGLLYDFANKIKLVLIDNFKLTKEQLNEICDSYSYADYLAPLAAFNEGIVTTDNFTIVTASVKFSLYAQLVRHRTISFVSNLKEILMSMDIDKVTQDTEVKISIMANNATWDSLIKKRMCWVAHAKLWEPLTSKLGLLYTEKDLPCKNGHCPFSVDVENRFSDKDPGSPCPKYIQLYNKSISDDDLSEIVSELDYRPAFWKPIVMEIQDAR